MSTKWHPDFIHPHPPFTSGLLGRAVEPEDVARKKKPCRKSKSKRRQHGDYPNGHDSFESYNEVSEMGNCLYTA